MNFDDLCTVMRYFDANPPKAGRSVKLSLVYGEVLGRDSVSLDEVADLVKYLAEKDLLSVGQNLPRSKLTIREIPFLKPNHVRVYAVTARGKDFLAALNGGVTVDSIMASDSKKNLLAPELIDLFVAAGAKLLKQLI